MRSYRNTTQELIEGFKECSFKLIPRVHNCVVDSPATSTSTLNLPENPIWRYEIEVRHRHFGLDNVKNYKVFEDDKQIHQFLTLAREFEGAAIDEENEFQWEAASIQ